MLHRRLSWRWLAVAAVAASIGMSGKPCAAQWALAPDLTVAGKYMAHGFNIGGDHVSLQPSVSFGLAKPQPGLHFTIWTALPADRKVQEADEYDFLLRYQHTFLADTSGAFNLHGYVNYWFYPHRESAVPGKRLRGLKLHGGLSMPRLVPLGSSYLVPTYNIYRWEPLDTGAFKAGSCHELLLSYAAPAPAFLGRDGEPKINLGASVNYHDGAFGVRPRWSHATAHLSTSFQLPRVIITPSLNYQWSFERSVNDENELWFSLSMTPRF